MRDLWYSIGGCSFQEVNTMPEKTGRALVYNPASFIVGTVNSQGMHLAGILIFGPIHSSGLGS